MPNTLPNRVRKPHFQNLKGGGVRSITYSVKVSNDSPCCRGILPDSDSYDEEERWETVNLSFAEAALDFVEELVSSSDDVYDTLTNDCGVLLDIEASNGDFESHWVYYDRKSDQFKTEPENPGKEREAELRDYSLIKEAKRSTKKEKVWPRFLISVNPDSPLGTETELPEGFKSVPASSPTEAALDFTVDLVDNIMDVNDADKFLEECGILLDVTECDPQTEEPIGETKQIWVYSPDKVNAKAVTNPSEDQEMKMRDYNFESEEEKSYWANN